METLTGRTRSRALAAHPTAALAALVLSALALAAAISPAAAGAEPSSVVVYHWEPGSTEGAGPGGAVELTARGSDTTPHHMRSDAAPPQGFTLYDSAGIVIPADRPVPGNPGRMQEQVERCTQLDPYTVRCAPPAEDSSARLTLEGGAGRDIIDGGTPGATPGGPLIQTFLSGKGGADRVLGTPGRDTLFGDSGRDVLIGYLGRDLFYGAGGDDVIRARDGIPDNISCGHGEDKAIRDRHENRATGYNRFGDEFKLPFSC